MPAAVYVGDDRTDLDAFDGLRALVAEGRLQTALCVGVTSDETPPELTEQALAGVLVIAANQHIAIDLAREIAEAIVRDVLECRDDLDVVSQQGLGLHHRRSAFRQLHARDFWRHQRNRDVDQQLAAQLRLDESECG